MEQSGIHISPRISGSGSRVSADKDPEVSDVSADVFVSQDPSESSAAQADPSPDPSEFSSAQADPSGNTETAVIVPICLEDAYGTVNVYLIPYIHPSVVREAYPEEKITDWTRAMDVLIRKAHVDPAARNIALAHQYVTASGARPQECDSEQKHIGGLDNVDYSVFDAFDYVALGHLHGPQRIGRDTVRYAGSPLKYSFSEEKHKKSVTLVEIKEKGQVEYTQLPLTPARDLKTIRGTFSEIMSPDFTASLSDEDYYRIILTDEQDIDQALARLRKYFYKNLMDLDYDNTRTRMQSEMDAVEEAIEKEPIEVLQELFQKQNGIPMNDFQTGLAQGLIEEIWGAQE